jgi:hypothetical protein
VQKVRLVRHKQRSGAVGAALPRSGGWIALQVAMGNREEVSVTRKFWVTLAAVLGLCLFFNGCTKLVTTTTDNFSAASKMKVTFRDGETLTGRFAEGEQVTFVTFGKVYRAVIEDIGPPDIILTDAYVQEEYDAYAVQRERLEGSELHLRDGATRIRIPRYKIVSVEEITFDKWKTAKGTVFWGFTVLVLSTILNARL